MTRSNPEELSTARRGRALVGPLLILVCVLHIAVGAVEAGGELIDAAGDGWIGAFSGERATLQWFLMTGFVGLVAGVAITVVERSRRLPWSISLSLLAVAVIGVSMAPASGFVLVLAVAIVAGFRSAYSGRAGRR